MSRTLSTVPPSTAIRPRRHPDAPTPGSTIESHYAYCFGCGPRHPHGLDMVVTAGEDVSVLAEFGVSTEHQGAPGLAHGGLLTCAFDEALGAVQWMLRRPAVTGRLETDFLRPVPVGSRLHVTARATAIDGRKVYCEAKGRLGDAVGPLAVQAAAVFVQVELEHFLRYGRAAEVAAARADPTVRRQLEAFDVNP